MTENFYRDNSDISFQLNKLDLTQIIKMREENFTEKGKYQEAPADISSALENYDQVLEIVGEIAGDTIAPHASAVDLVGAQFVQGEVQYAPGTVAAIDCLKKADLMGFTLPRAYGGLNLPKIIYAMAVEIVSRADASFMNIFGLQEIADTIAVFGSAEQKQRYLPRFARGEVLGAMALTEPDVGSDLQAVGLRAIERDGKWYLDGVKRFITNGCAQVSLVLARSEEGAGGGRGLSLFIYEREKNMRIRRIEKKLGIHGSPTCEMQFNQAPAELLGTRRFGLIKYTLALMNGARLAVSAQALGIAEAAAREANAYAKTRQQFGKPIAEITAVYEMLTAMRVAIEAGRAFLYETACIVDMKEGLEKIIESHPERKKELQEEAKRYAKYAALFTPALKAYTTEMANKVCYDAVQVFGGSGYMQDFSVERYFRDVRVTNIYEGTTQMQVVAAIGGVISGTVFEWLDEYEKSHDFSSVTALFELATELRKILDQAVAHLKTKNDKQYQEFHERRCVEIACSVIIGTLLCFDAVKSDRKKIIAHLFLVNAIPNARSSLEQILSNDSGVAEFHSLVNNPVPAEAKPLRLV